MVTHTPPLQEAIEIGMQEWPGISASECITRLSIKQAQVLQQERKKKS